MLLIMVSYLAIPYVFIVAVNRYYSLAHAVNERVMRQPSMLRAGTLRDYQIVGCCWRFYFILFFSGVCFLLCYLLLPSSFLSCYCVVFGRLDCSGCFLCITTN